jgi:hypothetical protein
VSCELKAGRIVLLVWVEFGEVEFDLVGFSSG